MSDSKESPAYVLVRFRVPGQNAVLESNIQDLGKGMQVVAESERGPRLATVLQTSAHPEQADGKQLLRTLNPNDEATLRRNKSREAEALQFCRERISALKLPMKLVDAEVSHSGSSATFYFESDDRVDFRALVKDLARRFHTRIEMRQIGVRDAARHTGGVGSCGRQTCCSTFLPEFKPISIRMAKDQGLALNQDKLSGVCGRLRCCLQYEQGLYDQYKEGLPKVGKRVHTPQGLGRVCDVNVLKRLVRVELKDGRRAEFAAADVQRVSSGEGLSASAPDASSERRESNPGNKDKK